MSKLLVQTWIPRIQNHLSLQRKYGPPNANQSAWICYICILYTDTIPIYIYIYRCINWLSKPAFLSRLTREFEGLPLAFMMPCFLYVLCKPYHPSFPSEGEHHQLGVVLWKKIGLSSGQIMVVSPQFRQSLFMRLRNVWYQYLPYLSIEPTWNVGKEPTLLISNHDLLVFHSLTSRHSSFPSYNHLGTPTTLRNCCWKSCTTSYNKLQKVAWVQHLQFSHFSVWFLLGEKISKLIN